MLDSAYACENAVAAAKTCTFRVGKVILQREIPKEQVLKLITTGKTDLAPEIHLQKRPPLLRAPEIGQRQSRFRVRRARAEDEKSPGTKSCAGCEVLISSETLASSGTVDWDSAPVRSDAIQG